MFKVAKMLNGRRFQNPSVYDENGKHEEWNYGNLEEEKIISIILLKRVKSKYEDYISQSQSAYGSNRGKSDVVWAHWWPIAKIQKEETQVIR